MNTLFSPITLGGLMLANRIVIPPMDQYSADEGRPTQWHHMHYGNLAVSGAGLLIVEATAVEPEGRISQGDLGLWNDEQEELHRRMLDFIGTFSSIPVAVQIGHAGRKGSTGRPWEGRGPIAPQDGGWPVYAPSALPFDAASQTPLALTEADIDATARETLAHQLDTVLPGYALASLQLTLPEAMEFMERAGYALSSARPSDLVVTYYISRGVYDLMTIEAALYEIGEHL